MTKLKNDEDLNDLGNDGVDRGSVSADATLWACGLMECGPGDDEVDNEQDLPAEPEAPVKADPVQVTPGMTYEI